MSSESKAPFSAGKEKSLGGRARYYAELERLQMGPLGVVYRDTMAREPQPREVPYLWPWSVVRPQLLRAYCRRN